MDHYIVTVGRQFGSMGRPIAKRTAELLGIEYYDRDIVEEVAKRMEIPLKVASKEEEDAAHVFGKYGKMLFLLATEPRSFKTAFFPFRSVSFRILQIVPRVFWWGGALITSCGNARSCFGYLSTRLWQPESRTVWNVSI